MASNLESTNSRTPYPGEPYTFPSFGNFGPPYIATPSIPRLTIGLQVWLFPTPVILNPPSASTTPNTLDVSTPPTHQPHVDSFYSSPIKSPSLSPSLSSEISKESIQFDHKKKKQKEKKKKNPQRTKVLTTSNVGSKQPTTINSTGSVDEVNKIKIKNLKPKFSCSLSKGGHFLRDFPGTPKVLEMWSSVSSASARHVGDAPSTSDIQVGKKKTNVKLPCMLCKDDHYSHLCPRMDEASSLLAKLQLPVGYHRLSPNPSLVDGMVNPIPSLVNLVDEVVNLVSSLVEPLTKVADPTPSWISPSFHLEIETQVIDSVSSSVNPTLHPNNVKVVNPVMSSIDPTPSLRSARVVDPVPPPIDPTHPKSAKVTDLVPSSVNPTLHLKSASMVNLIPLSVNPTLPLES
jgi:hypothetical protein